MRRITHLTDKTGDECIDMWISNEKLIMEKKNSLIEKFKGKFDSKPMSYWYETYGTTEEDIRQSQ